MDLTFLKEQYSQRLKIYNAFCEYFDRECRCLLDNTDISYYELSFRIKTWDSIVEKIERHKLTPQSIDDIYDVVGFRIITLFKRDVNVVCDIINREFQVLYCDDKSKSKAEDVFGYLSMHYEISLSERWLGSPSTAGFQNIKTEIQVRTFSQHVWAASSHLLQYKKEMTVPTSMRRNIYRLAAVLEIVDNELESIRDFRDNYQSKLREAPINDSSLFADAQPLDSLMLEEILNRHFPPENKKPNDPYDTMLEELLEANIRTSEQLEQLISAQKDYIYSKEKERIEEHHHPFYSYLGLLRIALSRQNSANYISSDKK